MHTRRRHPQDQIQQLYTGNWENNQLGNHSQQQQQVEDTQNPLYASASSPLLQESGGGIGGFAPIVISVGNNNNSTYENNQNNNQPQQQQEQDIDDKYNKSGKTWTLRTISTRLQASSGQALRTFIQQPLSAAAAVVTGYHSQAFSTYDNGNYYSRIVQSVSENTPQQFREQLQDEEDQLVSDPKEDIIVMAARDRTGEFANAIRSLQSRNITRAVNIRDPRKAKQVQSYSEFMMVAKYIGKNIASTYAKLEKLTLLAKKKTLFDDRPQEIQELTYIIKGDLNALNQQIARLQEISRNQRRTTSGKHLVSHSSNMVLALQSKLASMSTDFKQILEVRTENLKQQKTRRDQFGQGPPLAVNTVPPATAKQGSLLLSEENQAISIDMSSAGDSTPLLGGLSGPSTSSQRLQVQQQVALYDESDNYVQQRAETMQNIESTIVELGGIFQQLAHMVKEQEEIVERIDTNVQDAEINIEAAHGEILKYFQTVSKNRWLMIKIFGVLIFFFLFFIVFLT